MSTWDDKPNDYDHAVVMIGGLHSEIDRLRAALQRIVDEADGDDGLTAWDGGDIARTALADQGKG